MFDFTEILRNAEIIRERQIETKIEKERKGHYTGIPFILREKKTGDCKRFNNLNELRAELGYRDGPGMDIIKRSTRFKKKYEFFAYEWELLAAPRLTLL